MKTDLEALQCFRRLGIALARYVCKIMSCSTWLSYEPDTDIMNLAMKVNYYDESGSELGSISNPRVHVNLVRRWLSHE